MSGAAATLPVELVSAPAQPVTSYAPSRPLGVAILAVLVGIFGILIIIGGALLAVAATVPSALGVPHNLLGTSAALWGIVVLVFGLIILGLALGLWHLRMWALVLTLIVVFFYLVSYALAGAFVSIGFLLSLLLFVYLLAVHRHFH